MEVNRRSFFKTMAAGGVLLGWGLPSAGFAGAPPRNGTRCALLLAHDATAAAFGRGARAAAGIRDMPVLHLTGGLLGRLDEVQRLLSSGRNRRWVVTADDGSGAVFQELARGLGGRLLARGTHAVCTGPLPTRHHWFTASARYSPGPGLATELARTGHGFVLGEEFLAMADGTPRLPATGFKAWRRSGPDPMHLYTAGLPRAEAQERLRVAAPGGWEALAAEKPVSSGAEPLPDGIEAVGRAVTAAALGRGTVVEACSRRGFACRGSRITPPSAVRFTTFILDL